MTASDFKQIEEHYGVTYVGYYDIVAGRDPMYVFYQANPKTELGHSHYMGLFRGNFDAWYVTNAASITNQTYTAVATPELMLVSRYRHDYQANGAAFIDGGLDYVRYNPEFPPTHSMKVINGKEVFTELA